MFECSQEMSPTQGADAAVSEAEFPWAHVLSHLPQNKTICRGILGPSVATQGDGPFDESEFDDFLLACDIRVRFVVDGDQPPPPVVVFGREGWDEGNVDHLRQQTSGENVHVFSQELVIASMALGRSIFDVYDDITDLLTGHPALERFYFYEPDIEAVTFPAPMPALTNDSTPTLVVDFDTGAWPASGVLGEMGYRVGRNGLSAIARREVLDDVLAVELVASSSAANSYVDEWGPPSSRLRLQKMVNSIAAFARNARRRSADYSEAISDWESDLEWLRAVYGSS